MQKERRWIDSLEAEAGDYAVCQCESVCLCVC